MSRNEVVSALVLVLALLTVAAIFARAYRLPADPNARKLPTRSLREGRFRHSAWVLLDEESGGGPDGGTLWFWVGESRTRWGALWRARSFRGGIESEVARREGGDRLGER